MENDEVILDLVRDIREAQLVHATNTGRIEAKIDSLVGPEGRVTKLEEHNTRQFWVTVGVVPLLGLLHAAARKMGLDV